MNIQSTQSEIRKLVKEIANTTDIAKRVELQEKISGYLVYLSEQESEAHSEFQKSYTARKISESRSVYESTDGVSKAKESAAYICRDDRQRELQAEITYENLRLFRITITGHLDVCVQRTAHLRHELSKT